MIRAVGRLAIQLAIDEATQYGWSATKLCSESPYLAHGDDWIPLEDRMRDHIVSDRVPLAEEN